MDSFSLPELVQTAQMFRDSLDAQFQYWLATSFAVIVASFIAGDKLDKRTRVTISILYTVASLMFFLSYSLSGSNYGAYANEARERGAVFLEPMLPLRYFRWFLLISGTLATLWFLNFHRTRDRDDET